MLQAEAAHSPVPCALCLAFWVQRHRDQVRRQFSSRVFPDTSGLVLGENPAMPLPERNLSQRIRKSNIRCTLHAERYQSEAWVAVLPGCCSFSTQAEVLENEIRAQPLCPELRQKDLVLLEVTPESSVIRKWTALRCSAVEHLRDHRCHHSIPTPWHLSPFCLQSGILSAGFSHFEVKAKPPWGILGAPIGILLQMGDLS